MTTNDTLRWRKSSLSGGDPNACVEVALEIANPCAAIRDSKNPAGPMLRLDLASLLAAAKQGRLDG